LAYEFCKTNNCSNTFKSNDEIGGLDWFREFLKKHPDISVSSEKAEGNVRSPWSGPQQRCCFKTFWL